MTLRDYQKEIGQKAATLVKEFGLCYICAEVRCGKTAMAMEAARLLECNSVLFITKLKAISSIESDYQKFGFAYSLKVINYESLHKVEGEFDLVIIDESHRNGSFPLPAESAKLIKKNWGSLSMIMLSGTPSAESYSQLYHQFWISSYSPFAEWKSFYAWAKEFVNRKTKYIYNRQIFDYSDASKEKIDALTKHLFIHYTQAEAGFAQTIEEEVLTVKMQPSTYYLADKLMKKKVHIGKDGGVVLADTAVKLMNKCHQIYSGTVLTEEGNGVCFDHSKAQFIKERFAGKKIAVFYKFRAEEMLLRWTFGSDKITITPEEFNERTDLTYIGQIQSSREGLDLSTADALVMFNIDFSALSYWQARARLQSKDRQGAALVYWVFAEGGIEHKIYEAVSAKKDYTLSYFRKDYKVAFIATRDNELETTLIK